MIVLAQFITLTAPLFILVAIGYLLSRVGGWPPLLSDALARFVFGVAIPALLFGLMSDFSRLPATDARLLRAYFPTCVAVFAGARLIARRLFGLNGVEQSIFGLGTIFSNNVLLGLPIAKVTLGESALPVVSLVLVFHSLIMWTLVTVSVEWARTRSLSVAGIGKTALAVVKNPIVAAILAGTAFGFTGLKLPGMVSDVLAQLAQAAVPLSLVALGMGLAQYGVREGWRVSVAMTAIKLFALPLGVWGLAWALGLPARETQVIVLMAAMPSGANVYLMARQFDALSGPVAASLVMGTAAAAVTTPFVLWLAGARL